MILLAWIIPKPLRPLYYLAAGIVVIAVTLVLAPVAFILAMPLALLHDLVVKAGELIGCCYLENSGESNHPRAG